MRVIHFSAQGNHAHLIVEVDESEALSRGMQGLQIRMARGLNRAWKRNGPVFEKRFHHRVLRTPREVRNGVAYTVLNCRKHGINYGSDAVDDFSSGDWQPVWERYQPRYRDMLGTIRPVVDPETWMLMVGWMRWGLLHAWEIPGR